MNCGFYNGIPAPRRVRREDYNHRLRAARFCGGRAPRPTRPTSPKMRRFVLLFLPFLLFGLPAPAVSALAGERVLVGASVELQPAMQQLIAEFRSRQGDADVQMVTGSSRSLYADIKRAVPIDVFFAANLGYPARLSDEGLAAAPPVVYARNELLLWTRLPGASELTLDMLAERKVHVVAIPSRYNSPFGQRAEQVLREARLWSKLQAKLVTGDSVVDVARFVKNGSAGAGIVTRSVLYRDEFAGIGVASAIPPELYKPIAQAFVLTLHGEQNPVARAFAAFVTSDAGRAVFARCGYLPPADVAAAAER